MSTEHSILVVDDNSTNRKILVHAFEKDGHNVREASDGFEAIELVQEHAPSLILLDVMMPGRDGFEVCKILKADPATSAIPIVFITAKTNSKDLERAFSLGGCDYVTKPFRLSEVRARVSVHLNLQNAQSDLVDRNQRLEELSRMVAETNLKLARQARIDPLTSLFNRRAWEECVTAEHDRHLRHQSPYSILMLDVDHFKTFNDSLGHQAGDECLKEVAACITEHSRSSDVVGRYGGEEFVVLAPESNVDDALRLGERIRNSIETRGILHPASTAADVVTLSIGVCESGDDPWETVLRAADEALYEAKKKGRNCVCVPNADFGNEDVDGIASGNVSAQNKPGDRRSQTSPGRVLVVSTDQTIRFSLGEVLLGEGCHVAKAETVDQALDEIARSPCDSVVVDASVSHSRALKLTESAREAKGSQFIPLFRVAPDHPPRNLLEQDPSGKNGCTSDPPCACEGNLRIRCALQRWLDQQALAASYENCGEQTRILMLLFEFYRSAFECENQKEVLQETVRTVAEIAGSRHVAALTCSNRNAWMNVESATGFAAELPSSVHVENSVLADVVATGRTVILDADLAPPSHGGETTTWFGGQTPQLIVAIPGHDSIKTVIVAGKRMSGQPFDQRILDSIDLVIGVAASQRFALTPPTTGTTPSFQQAHPAQAS